MYLKLKSRPRKREIPEREKKFITKEVKYQIKWRKRNFIVAMVTCMLLKN